MYSMCQRQNPIRQATFFFPAETQLLCQDSVTHFFQEHHATEWQPVTQILFFIPHQGGEEDGELVL